MSNKEIMKTLIKGIEQPEYITLLLQLCKINSENKIDALHSHFCRGLSVEASAVFNDVKPQNLHSTIKRLNEMAAIVEKIKRLSRN